MVGQCPSAGGQGTDGPRVTSPPCQLSGGRKLALVSADGKEGKNTVVVTTPTGAQVAILNCQG